MILQFNEQGNLEQGIWTTTIEEVGERFAQTPHRQKLFQSLLEVLKILQDSNCSEVYLDGSFITTAIKQGDYDLCYEPIGMKSTAAWKELLEMTAIERKKRYLGDIFVHMPQPPFFMNYVAFWQTDKDDNVKGIIRIELRQQAND